MIVKNYFVLALNIVFLSAYAANVVQFQPAAIEYMQGTASNASRSNEIAGDTAAVSHCHDPNGIEGVCRNIKQCPIVLKDFIRLVNARNESYIHYIRQSNAICMNPNEPIICCPVKRKSNRIEGSFNNRKIGIKTIPGRLLTPEEGCGMGKPITRHRTINPGFPTKSGVYPWVTLIGYSNGSLGECGGSLITSRHVLTSAHCVNSELSFVRLGAFNISLVNDENVQDVKVKKSVRHPDFNESNRLNDIAILLLERDVEFTSRILPVCLPLREPIRSQNFVDYTPFVAAWLRNPPPTKNAVNKNPPWNVMRDWQLTILDNAECQKQYKARSTSILNNQFDEKILCADNINAGQDECKTDAGLMQPMFNPKARSFSFYQTGILAHGIGCKSVGVPVVYTRVQHFIDWIEKNI